MSIVKTGFFFLVCASLVAYSDQSLSAKADGNTFDRVRYNGGTIANPVDPKDWGNHLSIDAEAITLIFKDGQRSVINPKRVTSISYGQEAHRRVGTMVALAILVAPVALFGLFHKTRLHFIGVQYKTADGKSAGLLLQGDKDNYRAILVALQSVSGVPVSVSEKDREFIPVGVTADLGKGTEESHRTDAWTPKTSSLEAGTGLVNFTSTPDGADIYIDEQFVGNSPAALKLKIGKSVISAKKTGYSDWTREISISDGTVSLNANLVPSSNQQVANSRPAEIAPTHVQPIVDQPAQVRRASDIELGIGWIGIGVKKDENGRIVVVQVASRSPADQSGVRVGDLIIQVNGVPIKSRDQFDVAIASCKPGSQVQVTYMRGTWQTESAMTVGRE
jgi:hypothetical protein